MRKLVIILFAAILYSSCTKVKDDYVRVKFDRATFLEQKQLWQASNIKNYQYEFFSGGFVLYHGESTVENGNFKSEILLDERSLSIPTHYSSIDKIYESIESLYNDQQGAKKSDFYYTDILVEYDKVNHIPIQIDYGYYCSPYLAVDGNFSFSISNFKKLQD